MCWNAQVSLNTFIFATFAAVLSLANGFNWRIVLFIYVYSTMQFVEYMLWGTIGGTGSGGKNMVTDVATNRLWSIVGLALILAEPYFAINVIEGGLNKERARKRQIKWIMYILYTALVLYVIFGTRHDFRTTVGANGHLIWHWDISMRVALLWCVFLIAPFIIQKEWIIVAIGVTLFLYSMWAYGKYGTFGSMWCWFVVALWFYVFWKIFV